MGAIGSLPCVNHLSYSIVSGGNYGLVGNHYTHACTLSATWWPIVLSTLPTTDCSFSSCKVELKWITIHCWGVRSPLPHGLLACGLVLSPVQAEILGSCLHHCRTAKVCRGCHCGMFFHGSHVFLLFMLRVDFSPACIPAVVRPDISLLIMDYHFILLLVVYV